MHWILALSLLRLARGASSFGDHVLHEERTGEISSHWTRLPSRPHPDTNLTLGIALAQLDIESAEKDLLQVSDPSSPQFAQYWDQDQVTARFAPRRDAFDAVHNWLREAGLDRQFIVRSADQGWLFFNTTVLEAEKLLMTEFSTYNNTRTGQKHLACDRYSLPRSIRQHIDFAMPTIHLGLEPLVGKRHRSYTPLPPEDQLRPRHRSTNLRSQANNPFSQKPCSTYTTPDCLRALYNISSNETIHPNNTLGVFEISWHSWLPQDLDMFFSIFSPAQLGSRPTMERINGGYWQNDTAGVTQLFNIEADLDFEYTMALTHPQPVINYQVGEQWQIGTLNGLLAAIDPSYCTAWNSSIDGTYPSPIEGGYPGPMACGTVKPASVISVSYAWHEVEYPASYLRRQCLEFLKLGLQGVSVVVSSGDCGPAGMGCRCIDPSTGGVTPEQANSGLFNPVMPASCPYVLSVGGTQLPANSTIRDPEVAFRAESSSHISSSGGGFSNLFAAPAYQRTALRGYLDNPTQQTRLRSLAEKTNLTGRGYPDVSANAANYVVVVAGQLMTVQGTSASAPVVASILSKLNNARLHAGKRPVGFVNPVLYAYPHLMNDVVGGVNHGCGSDAFEAVNGWDPVTGLGTLDYQRLLELYLSLP